MEENTKRVVPPTLKAILLKDEAITQAFCEVGDKVLPPRKWRKYFKHLEISCHAFTWISNCLAIMWILWDKALFQLEVNLMFGLVFDLVTIALIKAAVRRRRPGANKNDMFLTLGPDQYSFPSGHVTRAFFIGYIFTKLYPMNSFALIFLYAWVLAVSVSRILLRRHHILDVVGGAVLGLIEGYVMSFLWLSESTCANLVSFISDEPTTLEGIDDLPGSVLIE